MTAGDAIALSIVFGGGALASTLVYRYGLPRLFEDDLATTPRGMRLVAATTTGLSLLVFVLVWSEFGDWPGEVRQLVWPSLMGTLLSLMLLAIPALVNHTYFTALGIRRTYVLLCSAGGIGLELFLFYKVGAVLMGDSTAVVPGAVARSLLRAAVVRVALFGILAMAILSGFGAASSLYNLLARRRIVTEHECLRLREAVRWHADLVEAKTRSLGRAEARAGGAWYSDPQTIESARHELVELQEECDGLRADLTALQLQFDDQRRSRTPLGVAGRLFDVFFGLYCIVRVFQSCRNLSPYRAGEDAIDPVTRVITLVLGDGTDPSIRAWSGAAAAAVDPESLARGVSLLLSLVVVAGSLRACALVLARWSRLLPKVINPRQLMLATAWLIGAYNIATAVVLCRSLPVRYGRLVLGGMGGAEVDRPLLDGWFDAAFLIGCAGTAIVLAVSNRQTDVVCHAISKRPVGRRIASGDTTPATPTSAGDGRLSMTEIWKALPVSPLSADLEKGLDDKDR